MAQWYTRTVTGEALRNIYRTFAQVTLNLEVVVGTPMPPTLVTRFFLSKAQG